MNKFFPEINKKLGFGLMRLPMTGEDKKDVDYAHFTKMVDAFIAAGFNYFDTARVYIDGKSETSFRDCVAKRYPRNSFIITDKLSNDCFETEEDIRPFFESQLESCGVDYFDFYLMHAQNAGYYKKYTACHAYEIAQELKREGKVRHVGMSFHDKAAVLDQILTEHTEIEVVQLQFNYADYDDVSVESRKCYEVCVKHDKPVIVMEPVKGGKLVDLPDDALEVLNSLNGGSPASYAIRFAASFDNIVMVLSGMSNMEQITENIGFMRDFVPLNDAEHASIRRVCKIFTDMNLIQCTGCRYCVAGCPKNIAIPRLFSCMNSKKRFKGWNSAFYYEMHTQNGGKASDCIECGACEASCPQHLPIRKLLKEIAVEFEHDEE